MLQFFCNSFLTFNMSDVLAAFLQKLVSVLQHHCPYSVVCRPNFTTAAQKPFDRSVKYSFLCVYWNNGSHKTGCLMFLVMSCLAQFCWPHCLCIFPSLWICTVVVVPLIWVRKSSKYRIFCGCVCSLSCPACSALAPYYIVICGQCGSVVFFDIIS
jgi:hypothetical protein